MFYTVVFMQVEVEADSEEEAIKEACKRMVSDPEFYVSGADEIEENEE
tara:strand:- start:326 stop:469 length:144 start_codon:yes stop_codon:yes gene_type:complete